MTDLLVRGLHAAGARNVAVADRRMTFTGGILRPVKGTNILMTVTSGELTVAPYQAAVRITYHLRFTQYLAVSGIAMAVMAGISLSRAHPPSAAGAATVAGVGWLIMFGAKVGQTLFQFPRWLRRTLGGS